MNSYSYAENNPLVKKDPEGRLAVVAILPALVIPGVGEAVAIAGIAVVGSYVIYEGTKSLVNVVNSNSWGGRYVPGLAPGQGVTLEKYGINQSPGGPEDWDPKNLGNFPKWVGYAIGGGIIGGIIKEFVVDRNKETLDSAKEFKEKSQKQTQAQVKNSNNNQSFQSISKPQKPLIKIKKSN